MISKSLLSRKIRVVLVRFNSSALYVTGDKANSNFSLLTPHIDFEERLKDIDEIKENLKARKRDDINLDKILKNWSFYKSLVEDLAIMDVNKQVISKDILNLLKEKNKDAEIKNLKEQAKAMKENYSCLRTYIYPVEETAALNALSIPNILHKQTPKIQEETIHQVLEKPKDKTRNHIEIAIEKNLLDYRNPYFWFLKNEAVDFQFAVTNAADETLKNINFTPFISPSFVRSAIAEGCCKKFSDGNQILTIDEEESKYSLNRLHLVGGASIETLMAYFARFSIKQSYFPIKIFSTGKAYKPVTSSEKSLFNLSQNTSTKIFVLTEDNEDSYKKCFDEIITAIKTFYGSLGYHYKLSYLPAKDLKDYESLRLSISMYLPSLQEYAQVGYLSLCGNYLSKRLLVSYKNGKMLSYARVIAGSLVNIEKLFGCILESNEAEAKVFSSKFGS